MPQEDSRTSKAIRRVVTGHDETGKSIVEKDDERMIAYMPKHSVGFGVSFIKLMKGKAGL
jgi:hypothetical protein